ncbi:Arginase/deacetylase [Dichomitus squalens]|nr:Arginase/deacetylase [Dichomitus squalens]
MTRTAVFLQKACLQHRYIRSRDSSNIVERPERLRAINIGLAAAIARLEEHPCETVSRGPSKQEQDADELSEAFGELQLTTASRADSLSLPRVPISVVQSEASVDILSHAAVKFVHGDIERDVYLQNLKRWALESRDKVNKGESEIPEGYSQGDLYLCPGSFDAIRGSLGTICEAVDTIVGTSQSTLGSSDGANKPSRAFVAVRPPGHHCGEDTPSGFCFVNNVAVGAAHAHLQHNINRVVILDIDLHHGNGTQSIAWQINEETYRRRLEVEGGAPLGKPGLQIYYGSIHDILSYPCEDGKPELVQAASISIHGPHGQHIENVHLRPYTSAQDFWDNLYTGPYSRLIKKAGEFIDNTGGAGEDVLVFISCGFDACEHEFASMSRHQRKVPVSFYHRFARDVGAFAERYAKGRLISVLEGGYSDRALTSGAMAHLAGLVDNGDSGVDESWWNLENLVALEAATKKRRRGRASPTGPSPPWLARALELFTSIDSSHTLGPLPRAPVPASDRTLRERKPGSSSGRPSPATSPGRKSASAKSGAARRRLNAAATSASSASDESDLTDVSNGPASEKEAEGEPAAPKKLPRVILKLGPAPPT